MPVPVRAMGKGVDAMKQEFHLILDINELTDAVADRSVRGGLRRLALDSKRRPPLHRDRRSRHDRSGRDRSRGSRRRRPCRGQSAPRSDPRRRADQRGACRGFVMRRMSGAVFFLTGAVSAPPEPIPFPHELGDACHRVNLHAQR